MLNSIIDRRAAESEIVRCPVFKIDLKGRFVYVDDMTERLLGRPQDMLFGRSLGNFLSEKSWSTLSAIFQRYRHYETSFEALELEFVSPDNEKQSLTAVISLNFIAGNPANYQIVLIPAAKSGGASSEFPTSERLIARLAELVASETGNRIWKKLSELMLQLEEVCQAGFYHYHEKTLKLLSGSNKEIPGITGEMSEVGDTHLEVVLNSHSFVNAEYSPAGESGENSGKIFTEICYPLIHADICWGMARFIVDKDSIDLEESLLLASRFIGNVLMGCLKEG